MLFKYFTEKETNNSIAINPNNVSFVKETTNGAIINFNNGNFVFVADDYMGTVTRLSEQ